MSIKYVLIQTPGSGVGPITVIGNRLGEPFTNRVNAQRSLTRRQKTLSENQSLLIREITK